MAVIHLNEQGFERLLAGGGLAMVDFWAGWCGPCKALAPTIDALGDEYEGRAVVAKLDVDEQQAIARKYRVLSIPTVVFFKDGEELSREVGLQEPEVYREILNRNL